MLRPCCAHPTHHASRPVAQITFDKNSAVVDEAGLRIIKSLAGFFAVYHNVFIKLVGYTAAPKGVGDFKPQPMVDMHGKPMRGTFRQLSVLRSHAVCEELIKLGIPGN